MSRRYYRPEINGLRAVAVLPVIAYHAGFPGFSGGFVGVDVFFVISGYLITGILAGDLSQGRYSIARFYERRARRILPALFVVLLASVVAAQLLLMPPPFMDFAASVFAVALFLSNMLFISEVDYFGPAAEDTPLLHTWSLAVEEQFYILFPLILWALWKIGRGRALIWGVAAITLASLAFSEWAWHVYPSETFYFLPSRAWELGAGALVALLPRQSPQQPGALSQGVALAGLGAILASVVVLDRSYPFPSLWAAIPVLGSVAVIVWATPGTLAARLLSWRLVAGIGLISYSAYLWHYPIFVFARYAVGGEPGTLAFLGLALVSLAVSAASWRFVEQPFRQERGHVPWLPRRSQVFAVSAIGIAAFAGFGVWGYQTEGRAALWLSAASPEARRTFALFAPARAGRRNLDDGGCRFNPRDVGPGVTDRLVACHVQHGPGLAIIGDSHAINLADALIGARAAPFIFGMTRGNCRPDSPGEQCGYDDFAALVAAHPELFARVVFEIAGQHLITGVGGRSAERLFNYYSPETPIPPSEVTVLRAPIDADARYLEGLARFVPVVWLTPRIEVHLSDAYVMARGCAYPFALRPGQAALFDRLAEAIRDRLADSPVTALDQPVLEHFTMPQDFITCDTLYWRDGDHLSPAGQAWLAARLAPALVP